MRQENIFIDAVLRFEETFKGFDFNRFWDLRGLTIPGTGKMP